MAEESKIVNTEEEKVVETSDRGLFDFMGKKKETKPEEEALATELEKVHVSEPEKETKVEEEEKKEGIFEKLHRSTSSSSSSSSDEEEGGDGEKKKKKKKSLKDRLKDTKKDEADTSVPIEKYEAPPPEEKKGFLEKIKEKMPGQQKKPVEEASAPVAVVETPAAVTVEGGEPKKGILEKIKEKLPGYHPKTTHEEEEKEKEKEAH